MKREVGIWIDHHKAVMITFLDDKEETREIFSNVEKQISDSGASPVKKGNEPAGPIAEDVADRKYMNQLNGFYDGVVSMLRNADNIWIIGPGEAKLELKKRLERDGLLDRLDGIETADKMTNRQLSAKIRAHFPGKY